MCLPIIKIYMDYVRGLATVDEDFWGDTRILQKY